MALDFEDTFIYFKNVRKSMSDIQFIEGNLVDVLEDRIYPAKITFYGKKIGSIRETDKKYKNYILPGLIDSHVHIESSLLVPSRFAEAAVPRGVCSVIADPHEIANVLGMDGVKFMIRDAARSPMKFRFMAPSCVPATRFETSGAILRPDDIEELMGQSEIFGLAEMMNYPGVINGDPDVMAKIEVAKRYGKPVDGHAPGLTGEDLRKYIAAGITTDHECTNAEEAKEKADLGMTIQVREGSACSDMKALIPAVKGGEFFLCTDDIHIGNILYKGYIDRLLRMAVGMGIDPMDAVKAATIWPARHYHLEEGSVREGGPGDLAVVSDLINFNVNDVFINGRKVAESNKPLFRARPCECRTNIVRYSTIGNNFYICRTGKKAKVRVIGVQDKKIASTAETAELEIRNEIVMPDPEQDVLLFAVANRYYRVAPMVGFIRGFGMKEGALATSISHDSHNLAAVATSYKLLSHAINKVSMYGGHYFTDGEAESCHTAPMAGLMSTEPPEISANRETNLIYYARNHGCKLKEPFMTLGFQSLLVVPSLKMSDHGLFDSEKFEFVDPVIKVEK